MIDEKDIARFGPEMQREIREQISKMVKSGYDFRFLALESNGSVTYDREAHSDFLTLTYFRKT
jgi:hypothetical protein